MSELIVGSRLRTAAEFDAVPVGTVIGPVGYKNETFTKKVDGWWNKEGVLYSISDFDLNGYNEIRTLPGGKVYESLVRFQWRYRDNAYYSAEAAGVDREVVHRVMESLHIGDDLFPLGSGVLISNTHDKDRLPNGTQLARGEPGDVYHFGLFVKNKGRWTHLLGHHRDVGGPVTVVTGDPVEWWTRPGTAEEQGALDNFKARAWRIGWKVKKSHQWCDTYESYMSRVGLSSEVLQRASHEGITVGDRVNQQQVSSLPADTVLRWVSRADASTFAFFIRDDSSDNLSRTRRLFGHRTDGTPLRHTAATMEVLWIPNGEDDMELRVDNITQIIDHVPVGTIIAYEDTLYVVCADRRFSRVDGPVRVIPTRGDYDLGQFGGRLNTFTHFPKEQA